MNTQAIKVMNGKRILFVPALRLAFMLTGFVSVSAPGQTSLHGFTGANSTNTTLLQANDGNFYGTTYWDGDYSSGTIYRITPAGQYTTLLFFSGTNGSQPRAELIQAGDGTLYGTTYLGGDLSLHNGNGRGTVFKMTLDGLLTTLVQFNATNGGHPVAALLQASDGKLY